MFHLFWKIRGSDKMGPTFQDATIIWKWVTFNRAYAFPFATVLTNICYITLDIILSLIFCISERIYDCNNLWLEKSLSKSIMDLLNSLQVKRKEMQTKCRKTVNLGRKTNICLEVLLYSVFQTTGIYWGGRMWFYYENIQSSDNKHFTSWLSRLPHYSSGDKCRSSLIKATVW